MTAPSLFIFGYGYVAAALAKQLRGSWKISGSARNAVKRAAAAPLGIALVDFTDEKAVQLALAEATHILCCIPPAQSGGDVALRYFRDGLRAAPKLQWLGYCSTTGVYGDTQGAWVDEQTPPEPSSTRTHVRLEAEYAWAKIAKELNKTLAIFRIAGIYGPGQSAIDQLRSGRARRIDKPGHVFSRAHVDDIAGIIAAAMAKNANGIINIADEFPSLAREVVEYAAGLMGVPLPPLEPVDKAEMSAMLREFYAVSRRVRAGRLAELGYQLRHPSYQSGIKNQWLAMNNSVSSQ